MRGEAFSRIDKVVEEILDNDVDISEVMTGNPSIDDLLAPDTDEESVAYSNEEFSDLLDVKKRMVSCLLRLLLLIILLT